MRCVHHYCEILWELAWESFICCLLQSSFCIMQTNIFLEETSLYSASLVLAAQWCRENVHMAGSPLCRVFHLLFVFVCVYAFVFFCLSVFVCVGKFTWRCPRCPRWGFSSDCWSSAARTCCQLRNKSSQNANELTKAWCTTFWDIFDSPFITLFFIPLTGEKHLCWQNYLSVSKLLIFQ